MAPVTTGSGAPAASRSGDAQNRPWWRHAACSGELQRSHQLQVCLLLSSAHHCEFSPVRCACMLLQAAWHRSSPCDGGKHFTGTGRVWLLALLSCTCTAEPSACMPQVQPLAALWPVRPSARRASACQVSAFTALRDSYPPLHPPTTKCFSQATASGHPSHCPAPLLSALCSLICPFTHPPQAISSSAHPSEPGPPAQPPTRQPAEGAGGGTSAVLRRYVAIAFGKYRGLLLIGEALKAAGLA